MSLEQANKELRWLNGLDSAVRGLIGEAQKIEAQSPGYLDTLFTTAEQTGTITVRDKIQTEIARIKALDVTGL